MKEIFSDYFCAMKNWMPLLILFAFVFSCKQKEEKTAEVSSEQKQVINQLQQQVQKNPDSASLRMRLVNTLDSLKMYPQALQQTDSLIKRDSLNNGLWFTKAQLLESNKDTAGAIRSYETALKIYPSVEAQLSLANLFAESKNPKALLICQNVRRMGLGRETDASSDFVAGVYNARTKNDQLAITLFDRAIANNYTLMEAYMEKGFIYYDNKKYSDALKVFQTAITVNQMYADAYYWRAKCEEALGNKDEAIADYKRSLGLDKGLKEAEEALKRLNG